jgi:hypothetical protein
MAAWRVTLTDKSYRPIREVFGFYDFAYQAGLSKLSTTSFKVPLRNEAVNDLGMAEGYIKAYRNNVLRYVGPIITTEESVDSSSQTLTVTSADVGWYLSRRLAGKSGTGTVWESATNVALIAKSLIDTTNTSDGETGLSTAAYTQDSGSARTYKAGPYRPVLECVAELGSTLDGFDWRILPVENWNNGGNTGNKIGAIQMLPVIGSPQPNAVFEYGTGRNNILSYTKLRSRETQANRVYHLGSDPATAVVGTHADDASLVANWKRLEDVAQAEMVDADMRLDLVKEHVNVRRLPRDLVRLTPVIDPEASGRVPLPFDDYNLGDTIQARMVYDGYIRFAGSLRVFGFSCTQNADGFERVELIVEEEN